MIEHENCKNVYVHSFHQIKESQVCRDLLYKSQELAAFLRAARGFLSHKAKSVTI